MSKIEDLIEIKSFLDGYNHDLKYLVNVEVNNDSCYADCVIHEPNTEKRIIRVRFEPFLYIKDLEKLNIQLYNNNKHLLEEKKKQYGITITKLETGNQKRLIDGFCYKVSSTKSFNSIIDFFKNTRLNLQANLYDKNNKIVKDERGWSVKKNKDLYYQVKLIDQFFISTGSRLYKGFDTYREIHKLTFDIETTGLKYQRCRLFAIGVRDNRGFETIIELDKEDDDESEIKAIKKLFKIINEISPAIVCGYNSEDFDFWFIEGRAKELKLDLNGFQTTLNSKISIKRQPNISFKHGSKTDKITVTQLWGMSVIDIIHATKRTAAVNNAIQSNGLKYIADFENIAKPNRTYISGEDNNIFNIYRNNKIHVRDEKNNYIIIPDEFQDISKKLYKLQANRDILTPEQYLETKRSLLTNQDDFVQWLKTEAVPKNMIKLVSGKKLLKQYLLDDLWETEAVDELYNQSSFMLAKMLPTTYQRICTMGTAAVWNLLMTAWNYENNVAIPIVGIKEPFSGGLSRTFKKGYFGKFIKIDFSGLYPAIELTEETFPIFDITNGLKKMLLFSTTARNIYKTLAKGGQLNDEETMLLKEIDPESYNKLINNTITSTDRALFAIKQLPLKILNNSQFGALGAGVAFNWSDNVCSARITNTGRLLLRKTLIHFEKYGCVALLAVTDGINFSIPTYTRIIIGGNKDTPDTISETDMLIEDAWKYNGIIGISALIEKYNKEDMANYRSEREGKSSSLFVDDDGQFLACYNLTKINYATLTTIKDKYTGEIKEKIKLTGNSVKSKNMPEYIEDFFKVAFDLLLHKKGREFVACYNNHIRKIYDYEFTAKQIATKNRVLHTIDEYLKRGNDKNGKKKSKKAYQEYLFEARKKNVEEAFIKYHDELVYTKKVDGLTFADKYKLVKDYLQPEPELDTSVYLVNIGTKTTDADSKEFVDEDGNERLYISLFTLEDFKKNPDFKLEYNKVKYINAFNSKVKPLLAGFHPDIIKKICAKVGKTKVKGIDGKKRDKIDLIINDVGNFESHELELSNYQLDTIEEALILQPKEIEFWNKYGYDPRLVWDGFTLDENNTPLKTYLYKDTLDYLNEKMLSVNKPLIKSIEDNLHSGDFVLIKNKFEYSLGLYNGTFISIVRENLDVPKSDEELLLEKIELEERENLMRLLNSNYVDIVMDKDFKKLDKYLDDFLAYFEIDDDITLKMIYSDDYTKKTFEKYVKEYGEKKKDEKDDDDDEDIDLEIE